MPSWTNPAAAAAVQMPGGTCSFTIVTRRRVSAKVQPVLPEGLAGLPFTPVEFDNLTATAYIEENGDFSKISWSLRASDVHAPTRNGKPVVSAEKVGA